MLHVGGCIPPRLIAIASQVAGLTQSAGAIRSQGLGFFIIQIPSGMPYTACPTSASSYPVCLLIMLQFVLPIFDERLAMVFKYEFSR